MQSKIGKSRQMKILYLTDLQTSDKGGLFKATYERIVRHNKSNESYTISNNYYDSKGVALLKRKLLNKKGTTALSETQVINELEINNLNFKNNLLCYIKRKFNLDKSFLSDVIKFYQKKYHSILTQTEIIHAHWGYPNGYLAYQLGMEYDIPYFITFHGSDINNIQKNELVLLLPAMEKAEKCFFVSKQLLENAKKIGYSGLNAEVTYNGVDINQFKIPQEKSTKIPTIGYVGALEEVKGADLLPEIFKHIQETVSTKPAFIITGEGTLREEIQEKIEEKELVVTFTGHVEFQKMPKILEIMDVLIIPSRNEGLGMIILEANAMGIPVVGARVGGIPEAIGYQENLITMNHNLETNMAHRVVSLINGTMDNAQKYRKRIIEKFQWQQTIETEQKRYCEALKKRTAQKSENS